MVWPTLGSRMPKEQNIGGPCTENVVIKFGMWFLTDEGQTDRSQYLAPLPVGEGEVMTAYGCSLMNS